MAVQIIAVRLSSSSGTETERDVDEVLWRQDEDGKCAGLAREQFAKWLLDNPQVVVYVRDSVGVITRVTAVSEEQGRFLLAADGVALLRLPRFVTPTG